MKVNTLTDETHETFRHTDMVDTGGGRVACQGETKRVAFRQMNECGSLVKPTHVTDACTSGPSMYEVGTILV